MTPLAPRRPRRRTRLEMGALVAVACVAVTAPAFGQSFAGTMLPTGAAPVASAAGDFDGDGKLDFAVANSGDGRVFVFLGLAGGGFSPPAALTAGATPVSLAVADF